MTTQLHRQPLSDNFGQEVINVDNISILDLNQEEIINLFQSSGVLLFRGFETNVETFTKFTNSLSTDFMDYTGGVFNRQIINGDPTVLTVNDFKAEIKLHGEMYYQKNIPLMLWFFCDHPPAQDGQTIICDGKQFFDELSDGLKELFNQKKLKYHGHYHQDAWQKTYKTDDLSVLEEICKNNDLQLQINEDESIDLYYICPAIHRSKFGEDRVFISSLLAAKKINPQSVSFDDDSEITDEIMAEINQLADKITINICWQKGDFLMVDNTRIMHGRRAFNDDQRKIYLRLCSPAF